MSKRQSITTINLPGQPDLSLIDQIPWVELSYAYGTAIDVPNQLRSVLDPDPEKRRSTFYSFTCNLFHQGTVYSATVPAISVLQHMLRYRSVPDKSKILETLLAFAVGFPEDIEQNVNIRDFLAEDGKYEGRPDETDAHECYLAVGAGVPLYEALLRGSDPCTVIAAAYVLAYFPAHAFTSRQTLLDIAQSNTEHDFIRSSALISCSYLGCVCEGSFHQTLQQLIEGEASDVLEPVPLLAASAAYALLREPENAIDASLRAQASALADRCLAYDILQPSNNFYALDEQADIDSENFDLRALIMPAPRFPWGCLVRRLQQITGKESIAKKQQREQRLPKSSLPHPGLFVVTPDSFDLDNIVAAVRKYHANFIGDRKNIVQASKDFEPFQSYTLQAWDVILGLLDDGQKEVRWAAAAMLERLGPLDEVKVGQLIERLSAGNNSSLRSVISKQTVTAQQCQDLCDRLSKDDFSHGERSTIRGDFRSIVLGHGTDQQLWMLYENGEEVEQSMAIRQLLCRGLVDASDQRLYRAYAADLLSGDYGRLLTAQYAFAKSEEAQRWFFENINTIPLANRWAIIEAMNLFKADLVPFQDQLFTQVKAEENLAIQSMLIGLFRNFDAVDTKIVDRLMSVLNNGSPSIVRAAVVSVLGAWLASSKEREYVYARLQPFLADESARVRRTALDQLANDGTVDHTNEFRHGLKDSDPDNVRYAMWHLSSKRALTDDDLALLLASEQPDRLSAETLLAIAMQSQPLATDIDLKASAKRGPLTESVQLWCQQKIV